MQRFSYKNKFALHENEPVDRTRFHVSGFAQRLVLTPRLKATLLICQYTLHVSRSYPKTGLVVLQMEKTLCPLHSIPTKTKKIRQCKHLFDGLHTKQS